MDDSDGCEDGGDYGGCHPWPSSADWSHRGQLVLSFCPSSWAGVFCGLLQSSLKRIVKFSPSLRPWEPARCSLSEERCPCCKHVKTGLRRETPRGSWRCWQQVNATPVWRRIFGKWFGTSWANVGTQDVVNIGEMCLTQMVGRNKRHWFKSKYSYFRRVAQTGCGAPVWSSCPAGRGTGIATFFIYPYRASGRL